MAAYNGASAASGTAAAHIVATQYGTPAASDAPAANYAATRQAAPFASGSSIIRRSSDD